MVRNKQRNLEQVGMGEEGEVEKQMLNGWTFANTHYYYSSLLYSAILCSWADSLHTSHVILKASLFPFTACTFNSYRRGDLIALFGCCMAGATWYCCCFCASPVYTIQPCTSLQCHFIQSHIGRVYVWLAVSCHLHFWQNDQNLLHASAVT